MPGFFIRSCLKELGSYLTLPVFSVVQERIKAVVTTVEALNATGVVIAIRDKPNHVSVIPAPAVGTLQEWIDTGSSHICTQAVKGVVVKWDGEY